MSAIEEAWKALREERRTEGGWHLRRVHPEAPCELFAGIHQPDGAPGLIVEVDVAAVAPTVRVPKSAGFNVDTILLGHSHLGGVRIALSLAHTAYSAVFAVLCVDAAGVAASQADARSAVSAFVGRLHVWQAFMARHGPDGLSETAVIGLMGELHILANHLAPLVGIEHAVGAWAGPRGEPNDFSLAAGYLEIKATIRQAPTSLPISNASQLDIRRGRILLGLLRFRPAPDGATLPDIVEDIRMQLADEAPAAIPRFAALLLAAGYVDAHRENYMLHLEPDDLQLFEVTADFPHIAPDELRIGVLDCSYTIDLGACAAWTVPGSTLASLAMQMAEDRDLPKFATELQSEIADRALGDMEGGDFTENTFVDVVAEHLAEIGMIENPVTCHFTGKVGTGIVRISGHAIPDDGERIDLLVAIFGGTGIPSTISAADMKRVAGRGARALLAASRNIHLELETANDRYAMMERISELLAAGTKLARVIVITDGFSAARSLEPATVASIDVSFEIYDIRRLMRTMRSGQTREVIDIDLAALGMPAIPCVSMPPGAEPYETYLAIFSGDTLYELYEAYGPRILEFNVRAFLQATGKVNRGIRDTIRDQPGYFMAYNNGISVTADEVRTAVVAGVTVITGFKGMQIVNGGQTTASIHRARKRDRLDLSRVHVPAKITRLPPENVEEMVPQISRYANTQNVIQEADFSSNEPFHIALERLSKDVWAPGERHALVL